MFMRFSRCLRAPYPTPGSVGTASSARELAGTYAFSSEGGCERQTARGADARRDGSTTILATSAESQNHNLGASLSERFLPEPLPAAPAGLFFEMRRLSVL